MYRPRHDHNRVTGGAGVVNDDAAIITLSPCISICTAGAPFAASMFNLIPVCRIPPVPNDGSSVPLLKPGDIHFRVGRTISDNQYLVFLCGNIHERASSFNWRDKSHSVIAKLVGDTKTGVNRAVVAVAGQQVGISL